MEMQPSSTISNPIIDPSPISPRTTLHPLRPYYQPQHGDEHTPVHWLDRPLGSCSTLQGSSPRASMVKEVPVSLRSNGLGSSSSSSKMPASFVLDPHSSFLSDLDMDFNSQAYAADLPQLFRNYFNSGFMGFTSTAMVMPFEVGKTLMQVQWIPKDEELEDSLRQADGTASDQSLDEEPMQALEEDEDDDSAYFTEHRAGPRASLTTSARRSTSGTASKYNLTTPPPPFKPPRRTTQDRDGIRPEYILPITVQGGVTEMMKQIFRWRGEGFIALWKGQLTTFVTDTLSSTLQPILLSALSIIFSSAAPSTISLPLEHHAYPALPLTFSVASYLFTGFLLSPLDLIRTRLIVQSSQLRYRKYSGPIHAFRQILREEGGWRGIYLHPALAVPALLDNLLRPALHLASPLVIDRVLKIDRLDRPVLHGLAGLGLASLGLLLILPVETVRKRLQLQSRATDVNVTPFRPCVPLRPRPYAGIVEAVYRILTEETGQYPPRRRRRQRETDPPQDELKEMAPPTTASIGSGLRQLYRGFNVGLTANVVAFVLGLLGNPLEAGSSGWAEV